MALTLETVALLVGVPLAYFAILVAIGVTRPRVGIQILEPLNAVLLFVLVFLMGGGAAMIWARNYIGDPTNHRAFWGAEIGPAPEESMGDRRVMFAHNALSDELGLVIATVVGVGLWLVINYAGLGLCKMVEADSAKEEPNHCPCHEKTQSDSPSAGDSPKA